MIKNLTGLNWESVANFESITIKNDWRLSDFSGWIPNGLFQTIMKPSENMWWPLILPKAWTTWLLLIISWLRLRVLSGPPPTSLIQISPPHSTLSFYHPCTIIFAQWCSSNSILARSPGMNRKFRVALGFFAMQLNYFFLCHTPTQWGHTSLLCDSCLTTWILKFPPTTKMKSRLPSIPSYMIWVGSRGKWRLKTRMTMTETRKRIIWKVPRVLIQCWFIGGP